MKVITQGSLNNPFMALKHKNFRLYWLSMCVSLIGTWMQNIAQPWLAYSLTNSPLLLSLVGIMQFLPMMLFSLFAGIIIDRYPNKRILLITQSASLVITLMLALLVWSGQVQYWHILFASAALGVVNTFDMPTRQSFVIELVGKEDLLNAIALNSSVFNIARILGPALAGIIMGTFGIAYCFYINSFSFAAVIISLVFIKPNIVQKVKRQGEKVLYSILEGLRYIKNDPLLLRTIIGVLIIGTFAMNFNVLVPVFSTVVLHQQEAGFGFLMSAMGIGSFLGAMFIATRSRKGPGRLVMTYFPVFTGIMLIFIAYTNIYLITALGLAACGFFFVSFSSSANSIMQLKTSNEFRGRVMSIYTLAFGGSTPIGNLYAGLFTDKLGPQTGFFACGAIILVLLIMVVFLKKRRHPGLPFSNK
ncbi:MAG: MFS transporter [Eubacteriales bacterium]